MWGAIRNAAQAVTTDLGALTKETLSSAQSLLEKLDGQNEEEEEEEDEEGRIDDDDIADDGEGEVGEPVVKQSTETAQESPSRSIVTKLKKQLAETKVDNKKLMTELQQVKTTMSYLKQGDGTENEEAMINEMESLQRELAKYKELEELSQERDQLILTLGAENEGVNVRLAALEEENMRLNDMAQEAVGKDDEINSLRTLVSDLEQRAMKKLDAFHANVGGESEKEEMMATIQQLHDEKSALDVHCQQLQQQLVTIGSKDNNNEAGTHIQTLSTHPIRSSTLLHLRIHLIKHLLPPHIQQLGMYVSSEHSHPSIGTRTGRCCESLARFVGSTERQPGFLSRPTRDDGVERSGREPVPAIAEGIDALASRDESTRGKTENRGVFRCWK